MIVSDRYRMIFMHVPKCAGTSVSEMLVRADPECRRLWGWRWMPRHQRYCDAAHLPLLDLPPHLFRLIRDYRVIAIVRDPVTRFLSAMDQHFLQHRYRRRKDIAAFLDELDSIRIRFDPAYVHFCPQHFFTHIGNERIAGHVLHIEDDDWQERLISLLAEFGLPRADLALPRRNQRRYTCERADDLGLSAAQKRHFHRLYRRDFELFGYTFDKGSDKPAREVLTPVETTGAERPFDFSSYDEVHFLGRVVRRN